MENKHLSEYTYEELVNELHSRFDTSLFVGIKPTGKNQEDFFWWPSGSPTQVAGVIERVRFRIQQLYFSR